MIKTIKDVVEARTGCKNIRLRFAAAGSYKEASETLGYFGLDDYYDGQTAGVTPKDEGVAIETEIGTLYSVAKI